MSYRMIDTLVALHTDDIRRQAAGALSARATGSPVSP
jgi:hypothetical protein